MPSQHPAVRPILLLAALVLSVAACGGDEEEARAIATRAYSPPATILPLPSDTPGPTDTPSPPARATLAAQDNVREAGDGSESGAPAASTIRLPADAEQPVVQIARVEPHETHAGLLADLAPDFALQAGGGGVFREFGGENATDWYQTALNADQVAAFVGLLLDDLGVLEMAEKRASLPVYDMERSAGGAPNVPAALGVIYVRDESREGRLVLTQEELAAPADAQIQRLVSTLVALGVWQTGVRRTFSPGEAQILSQDLGWWSDLRQPWTPAQIVAFGAPYPIPAAGGIPPQAAWPLEVPLAELFRGSAAGGKPGMRVFTGQDAQTLLAVQAAAGLNRSTPLWYDAGDPARSLYVVALRVNPPGGNHITAPVRFGEPPPPAATAAPAATP